MCGIAGALGSDREKLRGAVEAMCEQMTARGPDDGGLQETGPDGFSVVLGSKRLAIIDLSRAGHQPMTDAARRTTVVFNGMIYNFEDLRRELTALGVEFSSHCDTEVVLKAYGQWGYESVRRLRGMFAFAIWDDEQEKLLLARDRLGIKPLYYRHRDGLFLFASQVKALLASGLVRADLCAAGMKTFLDFGAVSEPLTAIEDVYALPAGHTATFRRGTLRVERYWDFPAETDLRLERPDAVHQLRHLLDEAVARHLVSDAPIGAFLSGGVDSSVIAALAARHTSKLRTVSVIFEESAYSEEHYMRAVVDRIGSDHVAVVLKPSDVLAWSQSAFEAMDQPTFDGINTYVVSRAAVTTGLKVALSGLGGDELFDGYGQLRRVARLERIRRIPSPLTGLAARALTVGTRKTRGAKAAAWLGGQLGSGSSYELLRRLFLPQDVRELMRGRPKLNGGFLPRTVDIQGDLYRQVSILELENYTRNVLLRDTDAMSMAQSLEVRVPYLDDVVAEWVLRLPGETKAGQGKAMLVDAVRDLLPDDVLTRPKQGFLLPLAEWTRGSLSAEVERGLREPPARLLEIIRPEMALEVWREYLAGGRHWLHPWALYALCRWTEGLQAA